MVRACHGAGDDDWQAQEPVRAGATKSIRATAIETNACHRQVQGDAGAIERTAARVVRPILLDHIVEKVPDAEASGTSTTRGDAGRVSAGRPQIVSSLFSTSWRSSNRSVAWYVLTTLNR